jgi:hypothetical protein
VKHERDSIDAAEERGRTNTHCKGLQNYCNCSCIASPAAAAATAAAGISATVLFDPAALADLLQLPTSATVAATATAAAFSDMLLLVQVAAATATQLLHCLTCCCCCNCCCCCSNVLGFLNTVEPMTEEAAAFANYGVPFNCTNGADNATTSSNDTQSAVTAADNGRRR